MPTRRPTACSSLRRRVTRRRPRTPRRKGMAAKRKAERAAGSGRCRWAPCAESLGRRHGVAPGRQRLRCAPVFLALAQHAGGTGEGVGVGHPPRSEEHTSELQSLMRISYAVFCLKKKTSKTTEQHHINNT